LKSIQKILDQPLFTCYYTYMDHPTKESLLPLLQAVDTAIWAYEVNRQSNRKGQVDWKGALQDLVEAWHAYQLTHSDKEVVFSEDPNGNV